jgi:hypothetical protein
MNSGDVGCGPITVSSEILEIFLTPLDKIFSIFSDSRTGQTEVGFLMRDAQYA